jgi:uncharacterized membrane protein YecN with MAPEG domain
MILPVTLSTAAAAALLNIWLTIRVGMVRRATGISVGDGGNEALIRRMRAQLNFIENAPVVLVMVGGIELARAGNPSCWAPLRSSSWAAWRTASAWTAARWASCAAWAR